MKRTNLVLDEALLEEAVKLSGEKTYSAAVQRALSEFVRQAKANRIFELRGSGVWEGELAEMRSDQSGDPEASVNVLVDTSVWVAFFSKPGLDLDAHVDRGLVVTCLPVVQEVLQGIRDEGAYRFVRGALLAFPVLDAPVPLEAFEQAALLYRSARRAGVTVRSSVDCLIAATALRNDVMVLHRDRDFPALARVSALREQSV